jgi:hypothetical protein
MAAGKNSGGAGGGQNYFYKRASAELKTASAELKTASAELKTASAELRNFEKNI